jgi:prephenate dehydrogenase
VSVHEQNLSRPLSTVVIFGPGLIGGSLALALRERQPDVSVTLWTRSEASAARVRKFLPAVTCDARAAAAGADLCVFCTPIGAMPEIARTIAPHLPSHAVVTDAGSVKGGVVAAMEDILGGRFVGSHPMAGSEKAGIEAARPELFDGATCILTPTLKTSPEALAAVRGLWKSVGGRVVEMPAGAHDLAVGRVSHLPHAIAAVLVNAVARGGARADSLAGGGYRDTTRIAAGPAAMWTEIFLENKAGLLAALADFSATLEELQTILLSNDAPALETFLSRAKNMRDTLQ